MVAAIPTRDPEYVSDDHIVWLLKRAFHSAHRTVSEAIRPSGVTPTQLGALRRLQQEPGLSGAQLARRLLVTPQAAQLAVTSLERQGLVVRTPDPVHGRIVRTTLTPEGRRVITTATPRAYAAEARLLADMSDHDRRMLVDCLQRLAHPSDEPPAARGRTGGLRRRSGKG